MLKIKDNVDLKELEKYGFEKLVITYTKRVYLGNDNDDRVFYGIGIEDRTIKITRLDGELDNTLYDLIKDGLVVKVDNE